MRRPVLVPAAAVAAAMAAMAAGCRTEPNPAYCDEARPCADGFRCERNGCVALGGDGGDCPVACEGATPYCVAGSCAGCREAADCPAGAPLCDGTGTCAPCASDAECAGLVDGARAGLCAPSGECVRDDEVVIVDADAACSAVAEPFCQVTEALAYAQANGKRTVVVEEASSSYAPFEVSDQIVRIFGRATSDAGATVAATFGMDAIRVSGAAADVELHRLLVRDAGGAVGISCRDAARCVVHRVVALGNGLGISMDGVAVAEVTRSTVKYNNDGGLSLFRIGDRVTVVNNFVYKNGAASSMVGGISVDGVAGADRASWRVSSNSLLDNRASSLVGAGIHCYQPLMVSSHVHWDHAGESVGAQCALEHSSTETLEDGAGNRAGDPRFVRTVPGTEDLHLQPGSPCLDQGGLTAAPSDDIDGDARDALPDMGADELTP